MGDIKMDSGAVTALRQLRKNGDPDYADLKELALFLYAHYLFGKDFTAGQYGEMVEKHNSNACEESECHLRVVK